MAVPNFELITELQVTTRRDFPLATSDLLNPLNTNALLDGEWLELSGGQLDRGAGSGLSPAVYPVHTERGRYDTQAIGKANVIFGGQYEAETTIFDGTVTTVGQPLMVGTVVVGGQNKRGLVLATDGKWAVGYVTKAPVNGRVRFQHTGKFVYSTVA